MAFSQHPVRDSHLENALEAADVSSAYLAEILDVVPDAIFVVDRAWHLRYANRCSAQMWRRSRDELIGHELWEFFPEAAGSALREVLERAMLLRVPVAHEVVSTAFGAWIEMHAFPMRDGLLVHFRQIAQRKRAEEERSQAVERAQRAAAQAMTLQQVTAALSGAVSEEQISAVVLREALPAFGAAAGDVVLLSDDGQEFHALCWLGYPEEMVKPWMRYPVDLGTPSGDVARSGLPLFLESGEAWTRDYPRVASIVRTHGLSAYAGLPLEFGGRVRGVVSFNFPETRTFSDEDRAMLLAFAGQCAHALERARLFKAEQRARAEAESANQAKSDFLAIMSHELRTPLTAILGYEELLADGVSGPVSDLQHQQLERIKISALHLLQLIDELLTFSRLEAGHETVHLAPTPVATLLDDAAALVAPLASAKRIALTVRAAAAPPTVTITTDVGKLRQVLVNLLSNAVKFTERGEITAAATLERDALRIDVRDTGIGLAPEHIERIFEPFWQVEQKVTRRVGGTGLGLSVSRALVQLLGGTIGVASVPGEGSTFTVRLPLARAS